MEDQINREMAVFHQVCQVNELDPKAISEEAQERFSDRFEDGHDVERLIWTAFDHRASDLIKSVGQGAGLEGGKEAYTIDGDPAAPAFVVNEEKIRSQYSPEIADKIIDALGQVQMPVTA